MNQAIDYHAILPELILAGTIILVLVVDVFLPPAHKWMAMPLAFAGVVASLIATLTLIGDDRSTFGGAFVVDNFALLFKVFFLSVALLVLHGLLPLLPGGTLLPGRVLLPASSRRSSAAC